MALDGFVRRLWHRVLGVLCWFPSWLGLACREASTHPSAYFIRRFAVVLIAMVTWSFTFSLDIASLCEGEIIPASQVKKVQHLEGGIVHEILVKEGDVVKQEQPLVVLQGTANQADTKELQARIGGLRIRIMRLEALIKGQETLHIPPVLEEAFPDQATIAYELFQAHRKKQGVSVQGQDHRITQRHGELQENQSRIQHLKARRDVLMKQVAITEKLLKEELSNEYERLELLKEVRLVEGQIAEATTAVTRLNALLDEEKNARNSIGVTDTEELKKDLDESRNQLIELTERLAKYSDTSQRTVIRAPVDGAVMTLSVRSKGEVIPPGGVVASIVPDNDHMLAEVKLPVSEIGFVQVGQLARLQLAATVSRGFAPISGHVLYISPDAVSVENRPPHFKVRIATDDIAFHNGPLRYKLTPGVAITAAIVTGQRSVAAYLFDPLFGSMHFSLTER